MKKTRQILVLILFALFAFTGKVHAQTANLQIIHNSADALVNEVDIFVNGASFLTDVAFRQSTGFLAVPAGVELSIVVAPAGAGIGNGVGPINVTLAENQNYIAIASGIVSATGYTPGQPFSLEVYTPARQAANNPTEVDVLVFHGSTDAPAVSVWAMGDETGLFTFSYTDFQGYLSLPVDDYVLEIRTPDGQTVIAAYEAPLSTLDLGGAALTVIASGFLNPEANSNGPGFGLFVATSAAGALMPLPLYTPTPATVVDIIVGSDIHTTLATAVTLAGLVETLQSDGPFTVFAPTDAAFAALPAGVLDALIADPTGALTDVLLYHVVAASALSTDLTDGQEIETVFGQNVVVTINTEGVFINEAQVIVADLIADNGVVHVIDAVLVPASETTTVVDIIVGSDIHTTLATAVTLAGLVETLQSDGPFTVFAPTDAAFAALPAGVLDALIADPTGALTDVLLYHVVAASALSTDLTDGQEIETVFGQNVVVTINTEGVFINEAQVIVADLIADNGVVHVIDAVLVPASETTTVVDIIVGSDIHTTLATAVTLAGLVETLQSDGPFTVFAPTDAAFAALPAGVLDALIADPTGALTDVLLYHVVAASALSTDLTDGQEIETVFGQNVVVTINTEGVFINDAQVIVADLIADNGVVHVIDAVLVPVSETTTVVDIIVGSDIHTTLATAVTLAGLVETLQGDGPFTVFAPTDAAFAALPAGVLDALIADPTGALTDVLLYHVVAASALSTDLTDGQEIETVFGQNVVVTINTEGVFINDAQVIVADLIADNGVVHVIDAVLVPILSEPVFAEFPFFEDFETADNYSNWTIIDGAESGFVWNIGSTTNFNISDPMEGNFAWIDSDAAGSGNNVWTILQTPGIVLNDFNGEDIVLSFAHHYRQIGTQRGYVRYSNDGTNWETLATYDSNQGSSAGFSGPFTVTAVTENLIIPGMEQGDTLYIRFEFDDTNIWGWYWLIDNISVAAATEPTTVVDIIVGSDVHTTLATAVTAAGLVEILQGDGPFTVFAPTDAAFAALPDGLLDELLADPTGALTDILLYHVVAAFALSTDLTNGQEIETVLGQNVVVTINDDGVFINDAQVTVADLIADNGVVHVIDAVLVPASAPTTVVDIIVGSDIHTTLATAVTLAGLVETLQGDGPFTVFAPTDAAFAALPDGLLDELLADPTGALTDVLLYHVVAAFALSTDLTDGQEIETVLGQNVVVTINNDGVFINNALVTVADLIADNGVVHVIDAVLVPASTPATVVDIIVGSQIHTTLATAVTVAGLVEALQGEGPFTVFAPTDAAFAALPAGVLDALLDDPSGALTQVLLYHVVAGAALSTDLTDGQTIATLFGENISVSITSAGVFINDAQVIVADLIADNGVVHVIDAVLVPTTLNTNDIAGNFGQFNVFPNPVRNQINLVFDMQRSDNVVVEIFNITGARVMSMELGTRTGNINERIDVSKLTQGVYIMNVRSSSDVISRKINIVN